MFLLHTPPEHAETVARAVVGAVRLDGWPSPVHAPLLHTLFDRLLHRDFDFETLAPLSPEAAGAVLESPAERDELVQLLAVLEAMCNPIPPSLASSIEAWGAALGVEDDALVFSHDLVRGELSRSTHDYYRLNWIGELDRKEARVEALLAHFGDTAFALTVEADEAEVARWAALEHCPAGSIGRALFDFYRARGFRYPGQPGAANPAVAQHDWVHLLSDYGTTELGELEVNAFMAASTGTSGTLVGLVGALALFESKLMARSLVVQGVRDTLSAPGALERLAEAIARGGACGLNLLDVDWFALADTPLDELRARFRVPPRSARLRELDPLGASGMAAPAA
jgi:hypothetical protein